jgi:integrase
MAVKESPKGSRRYVVEFEYKGHRVHRRCPANTSKAEAETLEATLRKELFATGELGADSATSLPGAIATWLEERVTDASKRQAKSNANMLADFVDGKLLSDIPEVAQTYRAWAKASGLSPLTINRRVALLKAVAKFAWKVKKWSKVNYSAQCELTNEKGFADMMPTKEGKAWVMLAAYTGLRQGELYRLQPGQVRDGIIDLGKGRANGVNKTKNKEARQVPVPAVALPYLKALPWTRPLGSLDWEWRTTRDAAGFAGTTYHDLRHTFASMLINNGVTIYTVARLLGNDPSYTAPRYAHLDLKTLKAAVRKLA